jgi:hypothetical protein
MSRICERGKHDPPPERRDPRSRCAPKRPARWFPEGRTGIGLAVLVCALGASGCMRSEASSSAPDEAGEQSAYTAHEHHTPAHKPHDLPGALQSLRGRCAALVKHRSQKETPQFAKELQEALDIAGWLPELAADSDLGRAEWDRVNEAGKRLADQLSKLDDAGSDDAAKQAREQIESDLDSVQEVIHRNAALFPARPVGDGHAGHHPQSE